jgi:hypothetical protein
VSRPGADILTLARGLGRDDAVVLAFARSCAQVLWNTCGCCERSGRCSATSCPIVVASSSVQAVILSPGRIGRRTQDRSS